MACRTVNLGHGPAIICTGRGAQARKCHVATCRNPATVQCDFVEEGGSTCDTYCCRSHARKMGDSRDFCVHHALTAAGWGRR